MHYPTSVAHFVQQSSAHPYILMAYRYYAPRNTVQSTYCTSPLRVCTYSTSVSVLYPLLTLPISYSSVHFYMYRTPLLRSLYSTKPHTLYISYTITPGGGDGRRAKRASPILSLYHNPKFCLHPPPPPRARGLYALYYQGLYKCVTPVTLIYVPYTTLT